MTHTRWFGPLPPLTLVLTDKPLEAQMQGQAPLFAPGFEDDVDDGNPPPPPMIVGTNGNDRLVGTSGEDHIAGGNGSDVLIGKAGDDILDGGAGNDTLYGGLGDDWLSGGVGSDTYFLAHDTGDHVLDIGGIDTIHAGGSYSLAGLPDIENLVIEGHGRHNGTGNDGDNTLSFSSTTTGVLDGGAGNDRLIGNTEGSDILVGGLGTDYMNGGSDDNEPWLGQLSDRDRFDFNSIAESVVGTGRDVIDLFHSGDDWINLGRIDADTTHSGNQAFTLVDGAFTGIAGQLRIFIDPDNASQKILAGDVNGDGLADFEIGFINTFRIEASDIIL